jgi:hypothetical protein
VEVGPASGNGPSPDRGAGWVDVGQDDGNRVDTQRCELAARLEEHEAAVWAECVDAAAAIPDNPLEAVVDRSGPRPLVALGAVDHWDFNRVVGLGTSAPAHVEDLDAICSFYDAHEQRRFRVEVTPLARPTELTRWMIDRGLQCDKEGTFKIWRSVERPLDIPAHIEVRQLESSERDAITAVSVAAWGAWSMPVSLSAWFGATVGRAGVRHYGVFEAGKLVATGALFIQDELGWFGFDATHPRHQGKMLRQAISAVRMADAVAQGCRTIHAESALRPTARTVRDGWKLLYERRNYATVDVVVAGHGDGHP